MTIVYLSFSIRKYSDLSLLIIFVIVLSLQLFILISCLILSVIPSAVKFLHVVSSHPVFIGLRDATVNAHFKFQRNRTIYG